MPNFPSFSPATPVLGACPSASVCTAVGYVAETGPSIAEIWTAAHEPSSPRRTQVPRAATAFRAVRSRTALSSTPTRPVARLPSGGAAAAGKDRALPTPKGSLTVRHPTVCSPASRAVGLGTARQPHTRSRRPRSSRWQKRSAALVEAQDAPVSATASLVHAAVLKWPSHCRSIPCPPELRDGARGRTESETGDRRARRCSRCRDLRGPDTCEVAGR